MFRTSVTDLHGEALALGAGSPEQRSFTCTLAETWNPAEMAAVVIYYNDAEGVLQVIDLPLQGQ